MKILITERQLNFMLEMIEYGETYKFLHGGNLDNYLENKTQKSGRYEYGPGLYLIDKYEVVQKYAKGNRKLYIVTVKKGNDINDVFLDFEKVEGFIGNHISRSMRNDVISRLKKYVKDNKINAHRIDVILTNMDAIKPSKTSALREFYVDNGIDYQMVRNPFGWGEDMMVLYNMKNIVNIHRVKSFDEIGEFL